MKVLYVKNGSERDKKFQLQTTIYEVNGKKFVKKSVLSDEALPHLHAMKENYIKLSNCIINSKVKLAKIIEHDKRSLTFEYIEGESLVNKFQKISNDEEKVNKFIEDYNDFLKSTFKTSIFDAKNITDGYKEVFGDFDYSVFDGELCFDSISNIDLIFSNIIYRNDEIYIIDYEWVFEFNLPINYTIFRALKCKGLLDKYSYLKQYDDLESFFISKYVCDQSFHKYNLQYGKKRTTIEEVIQEKDQQIQEREQQVQERDQQVQERDKQIQEKEQQIQQIEQKNIVLENKVTSLVQMVESMRIKNRIKRVIKKAVPLNKNQAKETSKKTIKLLVGEKNYIKLKNRYNQNQMNIDCHTELVREINFELDKILYVFPVIDWHFRIQRPQHIASQFRNDGYKVIYFSTILHISKEPGYFLSEIEEGILNVTLFLDENKNIYKDSLSQKNIDFILLSILKLEKELFINSRISIIDHPFWFDIANKLSGPFTIYDCMDYHEGFGDESKYLVDLENISMAKSDLLVLSSQDLYNRFSKKNKNVILVRNGCEFSYFNTKPQLVHNNSIKKQIGYYGAISSWFDTDLVIGLAKHYPNYDFVLIGSVHGCDNVQGLKAMDNINLIGEIPYHKLTKYLYSFDVCIMPFKMNELTRATNPVKVYEYLASGKPVVSTLLPEVEMMGKVVYTACNIEEFIVKIDEAISDNSNQKQLERIKFSKSNDWTSRYNDISKKVNEIKSNLPKVSIMLVTYNNLDFTKNCLKSMERFNNYENCEVIIVDNLSSDGTREYLTKYEQDKENIKVILHDENSGFAGGNNIGIKASSGDYVILLNNDTYVTPNWIVNLLKHFSDDKIAMVGSRTNNIGNEARIDIKYNNLDEMIQKSYDIYYKNILKQYEMDVLAFFCVAIKREVINKIGLLDEIYGIGMFEDDDYCKKVKNAGYRLVCADDVFIHHHLGASFDKNLEWKEKLFQKNKAIFESRYGEWMPHKYRL